MHNPSRPALGSLLAVAVLAAPLAFIVSCRSVPPLDPPGSRTDATSGSTAPGWEPVALDGVEVLEYNGERLDSISVAYRENSIAGPPAIDPSSYRLAVSGYVASGYSLSYDEALALPRYAKAVTLHCVEGWRATSLWEGPRIADLIARASPSLDATTAIFRCADGYETTLDIASIRERNLILACRVNGVALPVERGFPFMVVAEDRWGYKWARWVVEIELTSDDRYRGFWESRGFSPRGLLSEPSRERDPDLTY